MLVISLGLVTIFVLTIAFLHGGGLWSNAISLVNVVTAALLATNYFEPLSSWVDGKSTYTYLVDFIAIWALFLGVFSLLRAATGFLSRIQVKFIRPVNLIGGILLAAWTGWALVCFTAMTLHTAPLQRNTIITSPDARMMFGFAPDRKWLAFTQDMSLGAYATSPPPGVQGETSTFDPKSEFILKYAQRRTDFERISSVRVRRN